jgi:hypothetical protein
MSHIYTSWKRFGFCVGAAGGEFPVGDVIGRLLLWRSRFSFANSEART